jgi:hypothetical protein
LEVHEITGTGMRPIKLAFAALAAAFFLFVPAQAADITVFAAASLTEVLQGIGKSYEAKTHNHVVFSFAASSTLAKQIEGSSGADIFMSADTDWMDYLDSKGLIEHHTRRTCSAIRWCWSRLPIPMSRSMSRITSRFWRRCGVGGFRWPIPTACPPANMGERR